jgi:N-acetylmuramoyl-L-alanine amidase
MDGGISEPRRSSFRRLFYTVGLAVLGMASAIAAPSTERITDIRFWTAGDTTRVAIEVSGEFSYVSDRLHNPERIFFDLEQTKLALKSGKASNITVGDGLVKQVRFAEKRPGTIRVVLDLEDGVESTASQLSNPERLMIELRAGKSGRATSKVEPKPENKQEQKPEAAPEPKPQAKRNPKVTADRAAAEESPASTSFAIKPLIPVFASIAGTAPQSNTSAKVLTLPQVAPETIEQPPAATREPVRPAARELPTNLPEPKGAIRNANGERSLTRVLGLKLNRVVLDAGHGGHDQGTKSKSGLLEKDLVLDVAKRLATLLRERLGTDVVLTRSDDTYLSLEERTKLANDAKADLFLSIHANSSPAKNVAGVETFYLNFNTGRDDLDLATRENATTERSIADLKEVVSKITLRAKLDESREFALRVQNVLHAAAVKQNKDAKDRGVKRAPFVVLIGADMPSVLAEIGFLTNSRDESLLKSDDHRDRLAEALYQGIAGYAESLGRTGTHIAQVK